MHATIIYMRFEYPALFQLSSLREGDSLATHFHAAQDRRPTRPRPRHPSTTTIWDTRIWSPELLMGPKYTSPIRISVIKTITKKETHFIWVFFLSNAAARKISVPRGILKLSFFSGEFLGIGDVGRNTLGVDGGVSWDRGRGEKHSGRGRG